MKWSVDHDALMRAHAEAAAPHECVGALLGRGGVVTLVVSLINSSPNPASSFELSAREYLRAEALAAAQGVEVLGFYHSHVDAPGTPSQRDLEFAAPFHGLIIVEVRAGRAVDVKWFSTGLPLSPTLSPAGPAGGEGEKSVADVP